VVDKIIVEYSDSMNEAAGWMVILCEEDDDMFRRKKSNVAWR